MPHSTQNSATSRSATPELSRSMTSAYPHIQQQTSKTAGGGQTTTTTTMVGTALTSRDSRSDLPSLQKNPNAWKRASSPHSVAEAYADLVGRGGNIDEVLASRKAGDRSSLGQYNSASRHRTQYYDEQFRYKDNEVGSVRERVHRESPVIAELRTNVIIKDEFTLVTDLSYHLAQRYTRPDSSIMIKVDHSACLALGGTFDPCYILTVTTLPSQMGPTTNKRNAALIQAFMAEILSVPSDRGIVKFQPIEEGNYAMNGTTMLGEVERLEKHRGEENGGTPGAVKRALTSASASRKSMPAFNKKSVPKLDTEVVKAPTTTNGAATPVVAANGPTPPEKKRRSTSATDTPAVFELAATESNERPSTAHGTPYAAVNGLRMNGISKDELVGSQARTPNGRPKTIASHSPVSAPKTDPMPPPVASVPRRPSQHRQSSTQSTQRKSTQPEPVKKMPAAGNVPTSPRPAGVERRLSSNTTTASSHHHKPTISSSQQDTTSKPSTTLAPQHKTATAKETTYLDGVSTSNNNNSTLLKHVPAATTPATLAAVAATAAGGKHDPKLDAKAAEKNRATDAASSNKDTAANTAKRRSTVTATPKMPPPPPVPEEKRGRREEPKVGKRKSFLSAFRRSAAA